MHTLLQDLRLTARTWTRSPGFVLTAIVSLALGIGANTALFTLTDAVLLKSLPVRSPGELVVIRAIGPDDERENFSYPLYRELRDRSTVFHGVIARAGGEFNVSADNWAEHVYGELNTGNYFDVLGVKPYIGRLFSPDDDRISGGHPVAVLSYNFWRRAMGADRSVPGREILVNGNKMTVLGVTPPGFYGTEMSREPAIRIPIAMTPVFMRPAGRLMSPRHSWLSIMARLAPGIGPAQAVGEAGSLIHGILAGQISRMGPDAGGRLRDSIGTFRVELDPGAQGFGHMQRTLAAPLAVLLGAAGLVLAITCVSLANLLLARAADRAREFAVRMALGAGPWRLFRQFMTESLALGIAGGLAGLLAAFWLLPPLLRFVPSGAALAGDLRPDTRAVLFTLSIAILTSLIFGLLPALRAKRHTLLPAMKGGPKSSTGSGVLSIRGALMTAQVAFSLMLLAGAGLFLRTLENLRATAQLPAANVLTATIAPGLSGYNVERTRLLARDLAERARLIPGVRAAGVGEVAVLTGAWDTSSIVVQGHLAEDAHARGPQFNTIGPGYFAALGLPVVKGRDFEARDNAAGPRVAVVNEAMERYYFPNGGALGKRFAFAEPGARPDIEIVGVVKDSRYVDLRETTPRYVYLPAAQREPESLTLYLRTDGDPLKRSGLVRELVRSLDPNLPVSGIHTLAAQMDVSLARERSVAWLTSWFGVLATALAAIGIHGMLAFSVARRTREIGVRVALGAERSDVIHLVLRQMALVVGTGLVLGLAGAGALGRLAANSLYGVRPFDLEATAGACVVLAAAALLASYLPARRAAHTDPLIALRYE